MSSYNCIVYTPTQAGTYRVTLSVTDGMGKTGSDSIQITLRRIPLGGGEGVVPPEPGGAATESEEGTLPQEHHHQQYRQAEKIQAVDYEVE